MDQVRIKPKRQRKRQSRTEVEISSDSESDREDIRPNDVQEKVSKFTVKEKTDSRRQAISRQRLSFLAEAKVLETAVPKIDPKITASFRQFYMQRLAAEFAEDLDQLRNADDFNDAALPVLVKALEQGVSMFTPEEQQRLVEYHN